MMEKALGQAVCLGVHKGDPRDAWRTLCHTSRMCPSCEQEKHPVEPTESESDSKCGTF